MRKLSIGFLVLALLCFVATAPASAKMKKLGQSGMTFLTIGSSARATGMGDAFNNIEGDPSSAFYNPSGLAYIDKGAAYFGYTQWIADMAVMDLAASYRVGEYGVFGFAFRSLDYGDVYGTKIDETKDEGYSDTGTLDVGAYVFGMTYARKLTDRFSLGVGIKYAAQKLGSNEAWRAGKQQFDDGGNPIITKNEVSTADEGLPWAAFDLGFGYETGIKSLKLTASVRNFSKQLLYQNEKFQLPLTFEIGLSMDPFDLVPGFEAPDGHSATLAVEGIDPRDKPEDYQIGIEYTLYDMISLRLGRRDATDAAGSGLCAGAGFKLNLAGISGRLDYSYSDFGDVFDPVNRISFVLEEGIF